jgi:hypothetical protein
MSVITPTASLKKQHLPPPTAPANTPAATDANPNYWGIDIKNIAKDIQPGDDFYRYVNNGIRATVAQSNDR